MRQDVILTKEHMILGMIQGKAIDADGSVIYDWASMLGQTKPDEVAFGLNGTLVEGAIKVMCENIRRTMLRNLKGLGGNSVQVIGLCGDDFYDALTTCAEIRDTYKYNPQAEQLREVYGAAFSVIRYGNIDFINYRGTDDNSTVAISSDEVKFIPLNAGIFQYVLSPAERFEFVNTPGQEFYSWMRVDEGQEWAALHIRSYPLPVCIQPMALMSGRKGS